MVEVVPRLSRAPIRALVSHLAVISLSGTMMASSSPAEFDAEALVATLSPEARSKLSAACLRADADEAGAFPAGQTTPSSALLSPLAASRLSEAATDTLSPEERKQSPIERRGYAYYSAFG